MLKTSSHSVRHNAVSKDCVLTEAQVWAEQLHRDHPEIVRVGCFGSYVRGDYVPGSDLDVLIQVADSPDAPKEDRRQRAERAMRYQPGSFPVAIDLFVYTSAELAVLRAANDAFLDAIDREIRWITPVA